MTLLPRVALVLLISLVVTGCAALAPFVAGVPEPVERAGGDRYPDVVAVELLPQGERVYDVRVTLSSPYDTPERYADGWQVLDPDGNVLGTHTLLHDHANEQPFTRTQRGVAIPAGVDEVTVQGRDQANGFGGLTLTVPVPAS
jgi:hypothetical protein